jgi:hypothetical protein
MNRAISTATTVMAMAPIIWLPPYLGPGAERGVMTLGSVEKRGT